MPRQHVALIGSYSLSSPQGKPTEMKSSIERVIGEWERSNDPIAFGYLLGMHAFSLNENHLYVIFIINYSPEDMKTETLTNLASQV